VHHVVPSAGPNLHEHETADHPTISLRVASKFTVVDLAPSDVHGAELTLGFGLYGQHCRPYGLAMLRKCRGFEVDVLGEVRSKATVRPPRLSKQAAAHGARGFDPSPRPKYRGTFEPGSNPAEVVMEEARLVDRQGFSGYLSMVEYSWRDVSYFPVDGEQYWVAGGLLYSSQEELSPEDVAVLLAEAESRKRRRLERAQAVVTSTADVRERVHRKPIPADVRMFVWQRDGGRCVECGSNAALEFDHVIPVSLGGANTARNLQLLCEGCNRRKGASLT
jgi:hypothetical protein